MKELFEIRAGTVVSVTAPVQAAISVYVNPDAAEHDEIRAGFGVSAHDVDSALDPDEISRIEFADGTTAIIWKRPRSLGAGRERAFEVASVGIYLRGTDALALVSATESVDFGPKPLHAVSSLADVWLTILRTTIHQFLGHLKSIKQVNQQLESKISTSMENRYLLQMFELGESLTYYLNAIEANGTVLVKMRANAMKLGLTPTQLESLDDLILDNQQCAREAQIYSSVLSGLMDARGTMINNNMNVLLKNLTLISVIFLPLNLIASIGGMSEFTMMTARVDWRVAYGVFVAAVVLLGWLTWMVLVRTTEVRVERPIRAVPPRRSGKIPDRPRHGGPVSYS
jgi:magnesium transporter